MGEQRAAGQPGRGQHAASLPARPTDPAVPTSAPHSALQLGGVLGGLGCQAQQRASGGARRIERRGTCRWLGGQDAALQHRCRQQGNGRGLLAGIVIAGGVGRCRLCRDGRHLDRFAERSGAASDGVDFRRPGASPARLWAAHCTPGASQGEVRLERMRAGCPRGGLALESKPKPSSRSAVRGATEAAQCWLQEAQERKQRECGIDNATVGSGSEHSTACRACSARTAAPTIRPPCSQNTQIYSTASVQGICAGK